MNEKQKKRFMKVIVVLCLCFCAAFSVAVFVAKFFAVEAVDVLKIVLALFGTELLMTCVLQLIGGKDASKGGAKPPAPAKPTEAKPPGGCADAAVKDENRPG